MGVTCRIIFFLGRRNKSLQVAHTPDREELQNDDADGMCLELSCIHFAIALPSGYASPLAASLPCKCSAFALFSQTIRVLGADRAERERKRDTFSCVRCSVPIGNDLDSISRRARVEMERIRERERETHTTPAIGLLLLMFLRGRIHFEMRADKTD